MSFHYFRKFLWAALFYLVMSAVSGLINKTHLVDLDKFAQLHFQFLGFIAMLIYGVGYYLVPKLGKRELRYSGFVPLHFWLGNLSLITMIICHSVMVVYTSNWLLSVLYISIAIQIALLLIFIVTLWKTLSSPKK
ncbi:MAG: hypothetical protein ABIJ12_09030 [bacterium]